MTYYVVIENGNHGNYTAQVLGWPDTTVKGSSRQEVLTTIQQRISTRLKQAEVVPLEVESFVPSEHPWMKFAGMFEDEPMFDDVLEHIHDYREELDENPDAL